MKQALLGLRARLAPRARRVKLVLRDHQAPLDLQVRRVLRATLGILVILVLQALLALQVRLDLREIRVRQDQLGRLVLQGLLDHRVKPAPPAPRGPREKRDLLVLPDRPGKPVHLEIRGQLEKPEKPGPRAIPGT